MKLRFISKTNHGIIDYSAAVALIVLPFILGIGKGNSLALWISVITGVAVVVASISTNYKYGLLRFVPFDLHLTIDTLVASAFVFIPTLLNFSGLDAIYYWLNGVIVFWVVIVTENKEAN